MVCSNLQKFCFLAYNCHINPMQFPKSTTDLNSKHNTRTSRRQSRGIRNSRDVREQQFKISNPFRQTDQQNYLPLQIRNQIQHMEYISSKSIKNIQIPQCNNRRTSNFLKNLQMMQELAKKQQQKYTGMLRQNTKPLSKKVQFYENEATPPINLIEDDQISLQLNGFYDYKERIDDDFNIFETEDNNEMIQEPVFYSKQEIELEYDYEMDEEVNNYLG